MKNYYKPGGWNAICDVCGFKFKDHQLQRRWDGAMVCSDDWEPRHPADLIKIPTRTSVPAWSRPEPDPIYIFGDLLLTEADDFLITEDFYKLKW